MFLGGGDLSIVQPALFIIAVTLSSARINRRLSYMIGMLEAGALEPSLTVSSYKRNVSQT
jgi:hypothetical protein